MATLRAEATLADCDTVAADSLPDRLFPHPALSDLTFFYIAS